MSDVERLLLCVPAAEVAPTMLGWLLTHEAPAGRVTVQLTEVEAYAGEADPASHAARGRTPRTEVMFGPPGHAYVYLIYGIHHCVNAVTGPDGHASAVLIRALEPVQGIEGNTKGPGLLCRALGIDRTCNGLDLLGDALFLAEPEAPEPFEVVAGPRVGVAYAGQWAARPLRFSIRGNPFVSRR